MVTQEMSGPVTKVGVGYMHTPTFSVNQPFGLAEFLFVQFLVKVRIRTQNLDCIADPHSCIILPPDSSHWYQGESDGLYNHWFRASGDEIACLLREYDIPTGRLLRPQRTDLISSILSELRVELERPDRFSPRQVRLHLERLCAHLARSLEWEKRARFTLCQHEHFSEFTMLWNDIHDRPQEGWTVDMMADRLHLSTSRFSSLYREFFGMSAYDDLINARIERAKVLLNGTTEMVTTIAEQCGYDSIYHFSRAFRRRVGCSPQQFRDAASNIPRPTPLVVIPSGEQTV